MINLEPTDMKKPYSPLLLLVFLLVSLEGICNPRLQPVAGGDLQSLAGGDLQSPTSSQSPSDSLKAWADRLRLFGERIQQEEIFVHMDNSSYYLGDTLYFKAYLRLSDGRPSPLSQLLYVELLNQDGYLVERQKIEMKRGQGHGSFCLLDTLYGGYYELRAYTRWQLNWGLRDHPHTRNAERWFMSKKMARDYYRDYDKLYSRVFPVYDKPKTPGDFAQDMTVRPLRRIFKAKEEKPRAVVRFYPEGGSLVIGVPNRVAFEANDENGRHLKGRLSLKGIARPLAGGDLPSLAGGDLQSLAGGDLQSLAGGDLQSPTQGAGGLTAETVSRGRGSFLLTPTGEAPLKATFEWDGHTEEVTLPKAVSEGVAMQVTLGDDSLRLALSAVGPAASEPLGLTVSCHGVLRHFQELPASSCALSLPVSQFPTGVLQLTLFNAEGRIYADRLVFLRRPDFQPQTVTFSGLKEKYEPYEEINLEVKCQMPDVEPHNLTTSRPHNLTTSKPQNLITSLSLAVRDAAHSDYTFDSGNILTEMLLSSQVKGFVEQPEYFFEQDDEEHRTALDLLLMVQGWRRYDWVTMATPQAFTLLQPYERTEVLIGEVNRYQSEEQSDALVEHMDQRQAEYEADQAYLAQRNATLRGEDPSEYSQAEAGTQVGEQLKSEAQDRFDSDVTHQGTTFRTNASEADSHFQERYREGGTLKEEVLVHAEFVQPGTKENGLVEGEMDTYNKGAFKIVAPRFYDYCLLRFGAVAHKNYQGEDHCWVTPSEDQKERINYPDFYVKLNPIYPRFVKPYDFYQKNLPTGRVLAGKALRVDDDAILMDEIVVGARRGGLRTFDASKPAFVIDAYQAFNDACDAGLCPGYYIGAHHFISAVARTYIGDMNMERAYDIETRYNTKNLSSNLSSYTLDRYNHLPNLDMVYVYTDYSPRNEGDSRFTQSDQPSVTVDLRCFQNEGQRVTYQNRFMRLTGYSVCEDFYQPDYSRQHPDQPTDHRRTLYWNPDVPFDAEGRATVRFFNNSHQTQLTLSAEGMTATGQPLTGTAYPE